MRSGSTLNLDRVDPVALSSSGGSAALSSPAVSRAPALDRRWTTLATAPMLVLAAVALGTAYAAGALLPFWFLTSPASGAAFFPPAGLTLAVLALTPQRTWPAWLGTIAAAEVAVDTSQGQSLALAAGFALANAVEPLVGATLWRSLGHRPRTSVRRVLAAFLFGAVLIGPLVGAAVAATAANGVPIAAGWAETFARWWLGDAIGVLTVGAAIIAWRRQLPFDARCSGLEMAAVVVAATALTLLPAVLWKKPMLYVVLPVLIWAALRGGIRAVTLGGLAVAFAANWATVTGHAGDLIVAGSEDERLVFVQVFVACTQIAAIVLAVEVAERRRTEQRAHEADLERRRAEARAADAAHAERRRIAQESHDIVGHALNVMVLQAGAARRLIDGDQRRTTELLTSIEEVGRSALGDLEVALAVVDPVEGAQHGASSLPELVRGLVDAGMVIELRVTGAPADLSALVDRSVYRIVQEALTNVAKHASGAATAIDITYAADHVVVAVADDGGSGARPARVRAADGRGLVGMQERVDLLGGSLIAEEQAEGGFLVRAELPAHGGGRP